jgi:HSP20 family protein
VFAVPHSPGSTKSSLLDPLSEALEQLERERRTGSALDPRWLPEVALEESEDTLVIRVSLPDTEPEDVRVRLADDLLTLEADRRGGARRGRGFMRSFLLPVAVRPEGVDAALRDGVLTVTVDKRCQLRRRRIPIA